MDETSVLSPSNKRRGFFMRLRIGKDGRKAFRRAGQRRCSLMAVICDDADLQKHLPQVLLPHNRNQQDPGSRMKAVYAAMGSPLEAWHGSSGTVDGNVLKMWLRTINRIVTERIPDAVIVLTMDSHPVHKAEAILRLARKLGMHVAIIPAKCTWFLQTLDVKVFHVLKSTLRRLLMAKEAIESSGVLHWQQHVQAVAESIQSVLVQRSWVRQMTDLGMGVHAVPEQTELGKLVAGQDLSPRPPTSDELREILGKATKNDRLNWHALFDFDETEPTDAKSRMLTSTTTHPSVDVRSRPLSEPAHSMASSSACRKSSVFDPTSNTPFGIVRLTSRHRLPSAPNHRVKIEPVERVGPSAGTRSQTSAPQEGSQASEGEGLSSKVAA